MQHYLTLPTEKTVTYEYDSVQDMLYILFEPEPGDTFYDDVLEMPDVMLRYTIDDERLVGITVHNLSEKTNVTKDAEIRLYSADLVNQLMDNH
jgi:uncharacterized protein YuzE